MESTGIDLFITYRKTTLSEKQEINMNFLPDKCCFSSTHHDAVEKIRLFRWAFFESDLPKDVLYFSSDKKSLFVKLHLIFNLQSLIESLMMNKFCWGLPVVSQNEFVSFFEPFVTDSEPGIVKLHIKNFKRKKDNKTEKIKHYKINVNIVNRLADEQIKNLNTKQHLAFDTDKIMTLPARCLTFLSINKTQSFKDNLTQANNQIDVNPVQTSGGVLQQLGLEKRLKMRKLKKGIRQKRIKKLTAIIDMTRTLINALQQKWYEKRLTFIVSGLIVTFLGMDSVLIVFIVKSLLSLFFGVALGGVGLIIPIAGLIYLCLYRKWQRETLETLHINENSTLSELIPISSRLLREYHQSKFYAFLSEAQVNAIYKAYQKEGEEYHEVLSDFSELEQIGLSPL